MKVLDGRQADACYLMSAYGLQAAPQAVAQVEQAIKGNQSYEALYWDQVRRIVEAVEPERSASRTNDLS